MKNILFTIIILAFFDCKAQNPIIDLYGSNDFGAIDNAYYKDIENFLNQFEGTWIYTNGNTTLKVSFLKKSMINLPPPGKSYYSDFLVGEFQYIENGIEKSNTLSNLDLNHSSIWSYNLVGNSKLGNNNFPPCNECPVSTKRLSLRFDEPLNDDCGLSAVFVIRRVVEQGVEKLKVQFENTSSAFNCNKYDLENPTGSTARQFTIPYGEYTLIKL